jgi:hypothetical protein
MYSFESDEYTITTTGDLPKGVKNNMNFWMATKNNVFIVFYIGFVTGMLCSYIIRQILGG